MATTVLPRVHVAIDGFADVDLPSLRRVWIRRAFSVPAQCELAFAANAGQLAHAAAPVVGRRLVVSVEGRRHPAFEGEITAVEHEYTPGASLVVHLRAYDRLHRLRKRQPLRAHTAVTAKSLAEAMAGEIGVTVHAARSGPERSTIIQHRATDLELLVAEAARAGMYLSLVGDRLELLGLEGTGEPRPVRYGDALLEVAIERNVERAFDRVETQGWDLRRAEAHRGEASASTAGGGSEDQASQAAVGGTGARALAEASVASREQATALARAELERGSASRAILRGVCEGDTSLWPGVRLAVDGIAAPLVGTYVLTEVIHRIEPALGFVTELSTEPPSVSARPAETIAVLGVVSAVADPEGLGRVRARLAAAGDVETDWMAVCTPGAGPGKGLVATPDVGDHVLVLAANDDLARGVVLGGLYGTDPPPDAGIRDDQVVRLSFTTDRGQRIQLDAHENVVRIDDGNGTRIVLGPEGAALTSAVDLTLEAPGRTMKLRAARIDFERA